MTTLDAFSADRLPAPRTLFVLVGVLYVEVMALTGYWLFSNVTVTDPRFALYGLVWVNVAGYVFYRTSIPDAPATTKRRAGALAVGYFALLAYTGGLIAPGISDAMAYGDLPRLSVLWLPPGWGPALSFHSNYLRAVLMPAKLFGYLALAYLVYATAVEASGSLAGGVLGLFSCVSCTWPVLASVAAATLGGSSFFAAATLSYAYDLSTAVFVVTVVLLSWRPSFQSLWSRR
jgi:hypothetical protein